MHNPLTVTQLTLAIKKNLEQGFGSVSVRGEISNLKEQSSGHFYFTLKDGESQISAVLFKGHARSLSRLPKDGHQVVLHGNLTVYTPRGNYHAGRHVAVVPARPRGPCCRVQPGVVALKLGWLDP